MSTAAALRILDPGRFATIQDDGRFHARQWGVPRAGMLDPWLYRLALAALFHASGRPLAALTPPPRAAFLPLPWPLASTEPIRSLPGAQWSAFADDARAAWVSALWQVTPASDRMGARLEGPMLVATPPEIRSEPLWPGAVQVPPAGQPIVLLNDAQTMGGYPKIAQVIEADRWRLAHLQPGEGIRFAWLTDPDNAWHAFSARWRRFQQHALARARSAASATPDLAALIGAGGEPDPQRLWHENLVSGVWDATWEDFV